MGESRGVRGSVLILRNIVLGAAGGQVGARNQGHGDGGGWATLSGDEGLGQGAPAY